MYSFIHRLIYPEATHYPTVFERSCRRPFITDLVHALFIRLNRYWKKEKVSTRGKVLNCKRGWEDGGK